MCARNKSEKSSNLGRPRIFEVPEFDVSVADRHEVGSIFGKGDGLHLGRHLVGSYFDATSPVPHVDNHVMLRTDRHHVFVIRRKCLNTSSS